MPNTLTDLIPSLQVSMQSVIRQKTPINVVVDTSYGVETAALGQTIPVASTAAITAVDNTPGANHPGASGLTPTKIEVGITKSRIAPFAITGEERRLMQQNGAMFQSGQVQEAIRTLINEVWSDVGGLYSQASMAWGTPGTNPFASNADAAWDIKTLLDDSDAPDSGRSMILDATGYNTLGKLNLLQNVSSAGATETLREGVISRLAGFNVGYASAIKSHTKGTGTNYQINKAGGYAIGAKALIVDTGANTIVAGDIITGAGDSNKYIVASFAGGVITLNTGLKQAWADDTAITIGNGGRRYLVGHRSAIAFGIRPPAQPTTDGSGDMADDRVIITDPDTGLSMSFAVYKQYGQVIYQAELAWGGKVVRPDWLKNLLF